MPEDNTPTIKKALLYSASFFIPCILIVFGLFVLGMFPFGEQSVLAWDLQITYINYYEWYKNVLLGDGTIFYSFSKSLGGNMFPGWASMLASPLNLLVVIFGENPIAFPTVLIVLKFGLAGVSSLHYVRNRYQLCKTISLSLSIGYALMLFMTTECICPMWMDAVILLPLTMLGIYRLVNQGKMVLFFVCLLSSIIINYYNGYMLCLFSILFYLFESVLAAKQAPRTRLRFLVNPGRFATIYTLAIASSCIVLFPVALGLLGGKGAVPEGFFTLATRFNPLDLPQSVLLGIYQPEYLPQFYCGTLILISLIWFFLNERIARRDKIAAAALLFIMVLSTWLVMGERIWLGLRDGNGFYNRFAFLGSAVLLFMAARSLETLAETSGRRIAIAASAIILASLAALAGGDLQIRYFLVILILCISLPLGLVLRSRIKSSVLYNVLSVLLVLAVSCEATLSWIQVENYRLKEDYKVTPNAQVHSVSRYNTYYDEGRALTASMEASDNDASDAYRSEKTFNAMTATEFILAQSESMAFGNNGIALYDSTYDRQVQEMLNCLGYTPISPSHISYKDGMVVSDSLLGIKYLVDQIVPQGYIETNATLTWEGRHLYENPYALPLGFRGNEKVLETIKYTGNPFIYQNALISALSGRSEEYLVSLEPVLSSASKTELTWTIEAPENVLVYGFISSDAPHHLDLYDGEEYRYLTLLDVSHGMFPIVTLDENGRRSITLKGAIPESFESLELQVAYVNLSLFEEVVEQLRAHPFKMDIFQDGYVRGTYYAEQDELLFTTIPYDPGWTIKVNGIVATPQIAQETFIALGVAEGNSVIEMSYLPPGLITGAIVSSFSLVLAVFFMRLMARRPLAKLPQAEKAGRDSNEEGVE